MDIETELERIYSEGQRIDSSVTERGSMMLNITPSTGQFLDLLISDSKPQRILELGTSNGYSTIWIGRAACRVGAHIDTVDVAQHKSDLASANLAKCDLSDFVTVHTSDCGVFLQSCEADFYDLVYLDCDRNRYLEWIDDLVRVVRFGLLVADNATTHADELHDLSREMRSAFGMSVVVLPIGNGQMLIQPSAD